MIDFTVLFKKTATRMTAEIKKTLRTINNLLYFQFDYFVICQIDENELNQIDIFNLIS